MTTVDRPRPITVDNIPKDAHNDFAVRISQHQGIRNVHSSNITTTLITQAKLPSLTALFGDPNSCPSFAHFLAPPRWLGSVFRNALVNIDPEEALTTLEQITSTTEGQKRQTNQIKNSLDIMGFLNRICEDVNAFCAKYQKG